MKAPIVQNNRKIVDIFGSLPQNLAPSDYIRRWDYALGFGLFLGATGLIVSNSLLAITLSETYWQWQKHFIGMTIWSGEYIEFLKSMNSYKPVFYSVCSYVIGVVVGGLTFKSQIKPFNHLRHMSGAQLWEGEKAVTKAQEIEKFVQEGKPAFLQLNPHISIPKKLATRSLSIVGGVGSGKTVIMSQLIEQSIRKHYRAIIADVKGDFTTIFYRRKYKYTRLFCPWDARSVVWDVSKDIDTVDYAIAFANGLTAGKGNGNDTYWRTGASEIIAGAIIGLMTRNPHKWTFAQLASTLTMEQKDLYTFLAKYRPTASNFISPDAKSGGDMMGTLSSYTRLIIQLAQAWQYTDDREMFSWKEWATNNSTKQRQIIIQSGPDKSTTQMLFASIFNYLSNMVKNPAVLPDDEERRTLCFFLDELPQFGRFDIDDLILVGRSKGCVITLGFQDYSQLNETFGENLTKTMLSSVATKIVCWLSLGETSKSIAESFNYRRIVNTLPQYSNSNQGVASTIGIKEDTQAVVDVYDITSKLGKVVGEQFPYGWGIRALIQVDKYDPLILDWNGIPWKKPAPSRVPAPWTYAPKKEDSWREMFGYMSPAYEDQQEDELTRMRQIHQSIVDYFKNKELQRNKKQRILDIVENINA